MNYFLFGKAKRTVEFIARTGVMLALTLTCQFLVKLISGGNQIAVGSAVNLMLLLASVTTGIIGGTVIGLCTPFVGMLLGLGGMIAVVPFIAVSNMIYIVLFAVIRRALKFDFSKKPTDIVNLIKGIVSFAVSAGVKFLFLYFVVLQLILPLILTQLPPALNVMLGITQLFTALIGGALALIVSFPISKTNII